jgi:D-xylose transport system substrate-binding protein
MTTQAKGARPAFVVLRACSASVMLIPMTLITIALTSCTESSTAGKTSKKTATSTPRTSSAAPTSSPAATTVSDTVSDTVVVAETAPAAPAGGRIGFILPNTTDARWESRDRLAIKAACKASEIECEIRNAEGTPSKVASIAQELIVGGAKVIVAVPFDDAASVEMQEKSAAAGIGTIDYDRVTANGKPNAYVAFDFEAIGKAHAEALSTCFGATGSGATKSVIAFHADPSSFNLELFTKGFASAGSAAKMQIDANAVVAPDNMAAIDTTIAMKNGAEPKPAAVVMAVDDVTQASAMMKTFPNTLTGQAVTVAGLQLLLDGTACATIFKDVRSEADTVVATAISMMRGDGVATSKTINNGTVDVPYVAAPIRTLTKATLKSAVDENLISRSDLCRNQEALCKSLGL